MKLHLEKVGLLGSLFALMCCLGFGPLIALVSAIGAGFLINDKILGPLLVLMLLMGAIGLIITKRLHRKIGPLALHIISALTVYVFTFQHFYKPLIWVGIMELVGASLWDFWLGKRYHWH